MKALIISSGDIKDYKLLYRMVEESNYIVCADGGVNHILRINKLPDLVLGDLDSIEKEGLKILEEKKIEVIRFSSMKDETDTELCVNYLLNNGYKKISLMGVTGTRIDHTLANIYLLKKIYKAGAIGSIVDDSNRIYYVEDKISLKTKNNYFVSIIPLNEDGIEISLEGFLYPLKNESLNFGSTRGISNRVTSDYGEIKVHKGAALIIESKD